MSEIVAETIDPEAYKTGYEDGAKMFAGNLLANIEVAESKGIMLSSGDYKKAIKHLVSLIESGDWEKAS